MLLTAVSSEAWFKLRDLASVAGRGRLILSGGVAHASLKTAVLVLVGWNIVSYTREVSHNLLLYFFTELLQGDHGGRAPGLGWLIFRKFHPPVGQQIAAVTAHWPGKLPKSESIQPRCTTTMVTLYFLSSLNFNGVVKAVDKAINSQPVSRKSASTSDVWLLQSKDHGKNRWRLKSLMQPTWPLIAGNIFKITLITTKMTLKSTSDGVWVKWIHPTTWKKEFVK